MKLWRKLLCGKQNLRTNLRTKSLYRPTLDNFLDSWSDSSSNNLNFKTKIFWYLCHFLIRTSEDEPFFAKPKVANSVYQTQNPALLVHLCQHWSPCSIWLIIHKIEQLTSLQCVQMSMVDDYVPFDKSTGSINWVRYFWCRKNGKFKLE